MSALAWGFLGLAIVFAFFVCTEIFFYWVANRNSRGKK